MTFAFCYYAVAAFFPRYVMALLAVSQHRNFDKLKAFQKYPHAVEKKMVKKALAQ